VCEEEEEEGGGGRGGGLTERGRGSGFVRPGFSFQGFDPREENVRNVRAGVSCFLFIKKTNIIPNSLGNHLPPPPPPHLPLPPPLPLSSTRMMSQQVFSSLQHTCYDVIQ